MRATRALREAFPTIKKIQYVGPNAKSALGFAHYKPDEVVAGRTMKDWLRFSVWCVRPSVTPGRARGAQGVVRRQRLCEGVWGGVG